MKVYISVDIEGVAGITNRDEVLRDHPDFPQFADYMTREAVAACEGAFEGGATEVWIKDAHGSGRNLILSMLPKDVIIVRGWAKDPNGMLQEIDKSFAAVAYVGFHHHGGGGNNPLSHTFNGNMIHTLTVNGEIASELTICAATAAMHGIPSVFLSGDEDICRTAEGIIPGIKTVQTLRGRGHSTTSITPAKSCELIRKGMTEALSRDFSNCHAALADTYVMEVTYQRGWPAYQASFYPGAKLVGPQTIRLECKTPTELMSAVWFITAVS